MTSYLSGWLPASLTAAPASTAETPKVASPPPPPLPPPEIVMSSPDAKEEDEDLQPDDDDRPPAFPLLGSIQRSSGPAQLLASSRTPTFNSKAMPPPPAPMARAQQRDVGTSLALPESTIKKPPNTNPKKKARDKVALAPGRSMLDWAQLKSSGKDLRGGVTTLARITPSELKEHKTRDDAWSAFNGKVYNITPYLAFHPGGEKELMRVAGRDGSKLFALTHSWVNIDFMLDGCMVGFLVPDRSIT